MRILITGASGFVGQNLSKYLKENEILSDSLSRVQLHEVTADHLSKYDVIVHLAGKAHDLRKSQDPKEYYDVNFELTKRLFDVFLKSESRKFIFMSSVKAVADTVEGQLTEHAIPKPLTVYGKSKLMAEEYIRSTAAESDKSWFILRPCMIHGPGNKGNLNLLYKLVNSGIPYPLSAFDNRRSFLSIENLCYVLKALVEKEDVTSDTFNIADDESLSTNRVIDILASSSSKRALKLNIPKNIIKKLAAMGSFFRLPFNTERLNKLTENYIVSNEKIKKALQIELPIPSEQGILTTARSFGNK